MNFFTSFASVKSFYCSGLPFSLSPNGLKIASQQRKVKQTSIKKSFPVEALQEREESGPSNGNVAKLVQPKFSVKDLLIRYQQCRLGITQAAKPLQSPEKFSNQASNNIPTSMKFVGHNMVQWKCKIDLIFGFPNFTKSF